jgi:hypothetical protein
MAKLDRPNKEYQKYVEAMAIWEKKERALIGDAETADTREYYKARLADCSAAPEKLQEARQRQIDCSMRILKEKMRQLGIYEELYAPVQAFVDSHPLARDRFGLEFRVSLVPKDFASPFLQFIHQGKKGSFRGEAEGRKVMEEILAPASFTNESEVLAFLNSVIRHLLLDFREDPESPMLVADQLRQGVSPAAVYAYLFGLEYLEPRYVLRWEGRALEQLSPGERGTLLLIFYLLIDDSKIPLVMDQPEGNLDNQTVFEMLVDCVKEAKANRQIFIVTHNPNLAVVCDAEQVVHASLDKTQGYQLRYSCGSLENPDTCKRIVDVLEGTQPAIDNRVAKYRIIFGGYDQPSSP